MNPLKKPSGETRAEELLVNAFTRLFYRIAKRIPANYRKDLEQDLYQAQMDYLPAEWLSYTIGLALFSLALFTPLFFLLFTTISLPFYLTLLFSPLLSLAVLSLNLAYPGQRKKRYAKEFEADMAIGAQVLAMELDSGKRPLDAMKSIAGAEYGHFSMFLASTLKQHKAGDKLQDAIDKTAASIDSVYARRFAALLKNAYLISKGEHLGTPLTSLSEEIVKRNESELRAYTAKSGLFSQGATVLTIVLPTMLVSLIIISTIFLPMQISKELLTLLVGFGISLIASLLYIIQAASLPIFVKRLNPPMNTGYLESTKNKLHMMGQEHKTYITKSIFLVFLSAGISSILSIAFSLSLVIPFLATGFTLLFILTYPHIQFSRMQNQLEDELPSALEQAAQFMSHSRSEKILKVLAELNSGRLSQEFAKAQRELKAGARLEQAIEKMYKDTGSQYMKQGLSLLVRAHKTGLDMRSSLLRTADYMRKIKYIMQESKAATFSERATQTTGYLISAALFAVSLSLGTGLSNALSGTMFSTDPLVLEAIATGIQINLLLHPIVIAWNLSALENDRKRAFFYAPFLLVFGNLLFLSLKDIPLI